jgi:diacylglycerol kinase family enzyme
VVNAVDFSSTTLAFLPFGTGNALAYALNYQGGVPAIADRIRKAAVHSCDLIDCNGRKKAFMASMGIDGTIIQQYNRLRLRGYYGLRAHLMAGIRAYFKEYRPTDGLLKVDGHIREVKQILSLMIVAPGPLG